MRWFAAYWITVLISLSAAGVSWLSGQELGRLGDVLQRLAPAVPAWWTIPALVAGCYAVVRLVLHRVVAYTESAIEASPRSEGMGGRRRSAVGNAVYAAFGNPTGWWLAPFAATLGLAAALASVVRWSMYVIGGGRLGGGNDFINLLLVLAVLYAATVTSAMLFPDQPQPLRPGPELEPDPILAIPETERASAPAPQPRFGRAPS